MKNGGCAFPMLDTTQADNINSLACVDCGMSLRDYFAGQALTGILAYPSTEHETAEDFDPAVVAGRSYAFADAMLKEREVGPS